MAMQVGELFATFSLDTSGFAEAVAGIENQIEQMGSGLANVGASLEQYLTGPITSFAKSALDAGLSFSSQMSAVEAISGATGENLEALRQAAIDAGSATSFTATEAGEALQYMAMAGWRTEEMLGGLRPIMDLAAASGADLAATSDIVTDAMTAFGYAADETWKIVRDGEAIDTGISNVQHFADVLAATATNSNTNVEMLGMSFKYAAPLAGALGYSVEDVAMALGLMANQGVKASQAGTTLRSLFKRLADPPKAARAAMQEYGISLTDTEGKMKSFGEVITELRAVSAGMTETQKAAFASAIAGTTGMSGFLALLNAAEADVDQLTQAIGDCNNATTEMADTRLNNAAGAITIFRSAVEGLQITLFDLVESPLKRMIEGMTDLVNAFRDADPFLQKATMGFLTVAAGAGPALQVLELFGPAIMAMVTPMGALAAGIGAFSLAFLDFATATGGAFDEAGNYTARGMGRIETAIRSLNEHALPNLRRFRVQAESYIYSVANFMPGMISALTDSARLLLPSAVETIITLLSAGVAGISQYLDGLLDLGAAVITGMLTGVADGLPRLISGLGVFMKNALTASTDPQRFRQAALQVISAMENAIAAVHWKRLNDDLSAAMTQAIRQVRELAGNITTMLSSIDLSGLGAALQAGLAQAGTWLKQLVLGDDYDQGTWGDVGAEINRWIRAGFSQAGTWLKQLILGSDFDNGSTWRDVGAKVWGWIRSGFTVASDFLLGLILGDSYNEGSTWTKVGEDIWAWIRSGFDTTSDFLLQAILGENFSASSTWLDAGAKIWADIQAGFDTAAGFLKNLILGEDADDGTWVDVGARIGAWIQSGVYTVGNFLKTLLGGDEESGDWRSLGASIAGRIREGMETAGTFLKALILGDDYESGSTWVDAGTKIWGWIRSGFEVRSSFLQGLIFGDTEGGEPDWTARGQQVWQAILNYGAYAIALAVSKEVLPRLKKHYSYKDSINIYVISTIYFVNHYVPARDLHELYIQSVLCMFYPQATLSENVAGQFIEDLGRHNRKMKSVEQDLIDDGSGLYNIDGHVMLCVSNNNELADYGAKYESIRNTQANFMTVFDAKKKRAVSCEAFEGGIPDKTAVKNTFRSHKFKNARLRLDSGFYSEENFSLYRANECVFVIPTPGTTILKKTVLRHMSFVGSFIHKRKDKHAKIVYSSVQFKEYTVSEIEEIAIQDAKDDAEEKNKELEQKAKPDEKIAKAYPRKIERSKYPKDRVIVYKDQIMHDKLYFDYSCLIGDGTHTQEKLDKLESGFGVIALRTNDPKITAEQLYLEYKDRWPIETYNNYVKNIIDFVGLHEENYYTQQGVGFLMVIESLISSEVERLIQEATLSYVHNMSKEECIRVAGREKVALLPDNNWYCNEMKGNIKELLVYMGVDVEADLDKLNKLTAGILKVG